MDKLGSRGAILCGSLYVDPLTNVVFINSDVVQGHAICGGKVKFDGRRLMSFHTLKVYDINHD